MCVVLGFGNGTMDYGLLPVKNLTDIGTREGWLAVGGSDTGPELFLEATFENDRMA